MRAKLFLFMRISLLTVIFGIIAVAVMRPIRIGFDKNETTVS